MYDLFTACCLCCACTSLFGDTHCCASFCSGFRPKYTGDQEVNDREADLFHSSQPAPKSSMELKSSVSTSPPPESHQTKHESASEDTPDAANQGSPQSRQLDMGQPKPSHSKQPSVPRGPMPWEDA
ncbi:hypothetical protein HGRIS_001757 [Hohenbuehelia grisea]|uniref:Secreted protein n=1 Tax=Hohenbuehelia grisea TaxID=104357 RepID=A0ABR3JIE2_9AGAR